MISELILWYGEATRAAMDWYIAHTNQILDSLHTALSFSFDTLLWITAALSFLFLVIAVTSTVARYRTRTYAFNARTAPQVSIHIPTRNELAAITCAERCLAFDYPAEKVQILIGDDSSEAAVSRKLAAFAKANPRVRVIKRAQNTGYKPGNLNNMLRHTSGEIIVVFDSDFLPPADFLRRIVAPFQHEPKLAAVQARWDPINQERGLTTALGVAITEVFHQIFLPFMHHVSGSVTLCGSAEAVRRSHLERMGRWKEGSLTEDIEFSLRLYREGLQVRYLHDLTCGCEVPHRPIDLYKQQMRWAYGVISAIKEHLWGILRARTTISMKLNTFWIAAGYCLSVLLILLFATGTLAFITHPPAAFDVGLFLAETARNIAMTSGLIITFFLALALGKRWSVIPKVIPSAFSVGIVVTYYVNKGIYRALSGKSMQWFLLKKQGNQVRA